jgi:hypothetical protein
MYFDGEETDDIFTLHNPTKENQSSADDLEHEIEKFNIEISLTSCFGLMTDSAVVDSALVDAALRKSGLI